MPLRRLPLSRGGLPLLRGMDGCDEHNGENALGTPILSGSRRRVAEDGRRLREQCPHGPWKDPFREGEEADRFYLIREGSVVLEVFNLELGSLPLQTLEAGQVVGWSWLVPPYRWRFDARCVTDVRAFALDGLCLRAKCEADPHLGYELLKRFAMLIDQRLQATRRQLVEAQSRAI